MRNKKNISFESVKKLEYIINSIFSGNHAKSLFDYYSVRFKIPSQVVNHYLKQRLSWNYRTKDTKFSYWIRLPFIFFSILQYIIFISTLAIFSKKIKKNPSTKKFDLLVDDIQHMNEIDRWNYLQEKFGRDKTIFIARSKEVKNDKDRNIFHLIPTKGYDRDYLHKNVITLLFRDLFYLTRKSFQLKINLVHLHSFFVNDFIYYSTLFQMNKAKYMIQDRNLGRTNALKNYLFKKFGGIASSCIQKNIVQHNEYALFYDTDIFFTYGNRTADDILDLGARIDKIIPVGSFAMESSHKNRARYSNQSEAQEDVIDVLYIGINAVTSKKTNWDGYYESIKWLANLYKNEKTLNIAIKHHPSWVSDARELSITKNTHIKYIKETDDSYQVASQARVIITYGSSMGYELLGQGKNVFFIDPDEKNPFINKFVYRDKKVINNYEQFEFLIRSKDKLHNNTKRDDYCNSEEHTSSRIHESLVLYSHKRTA
tara:strand:+ start:3213 stop:4664 length:1452 start_codon:yes stop_codon:yes gene_type:complete